MLDPQNTPYSNGRAMGCLLWMFVKKLTALYRYRTVYVSIHPFIISFQKYFHLRKQGKFIYLTSGHTMSRMEYMGFVTNFCLMVPWRQFRKNDKGTEGKSLLEHWRDNLTPLVDVYKWQGITCMQCLCVTIIKASAVQLVLYLRVEVVVNVGNNDS